MQGTLREMHLSAVLSPCPYSSLGTSTAGQYLPAQAWLQYVRTAGSILNDLSAHGAHAHGKLMLMHTGILLYTLFLHRTTSDHSRLPPPRDIIISTTTHMARATAYHVCAATAMLLAILFSSLLYAHQLASSHRIDTSLPLDALNVITPGDAVDGLPPRADTPISSSLGQHETRDEILSDKTNIPSLDLKEDFLKPKGKVVIPSEYKKAVKKGELLLCYMKGEASPGSKGTSAWQNFEQLDQWGWKREIDAGDDSKDYSHVVGKVWFQVESMVCESLLAYAEVVY